MHMKVFKLYALSKHQFLTLFLGCILQDGGHPMDCIFKYVRESKHMGQLRIVLEERLCHGLLCLSVLSIKKLQN